MEKKCSKCGEVKPHNDYYRQSHKGKSRIEACCKTCANARRGKRKAKTAGHEYLGRKAWNAQRKEEAAARQIVKAQERASRPPKERKKAPEKSPWEKAAQKQLQMLKNRTRQRLLAGWERKAATVIRGLRTREVGQIRPKRTEAKETTWQMASLKQLKALKARTSRRKQDAWRRKVASVERNQRRRFQWKKRRSLSGS